MLKFCLRIGCWMVAMAITAFLAVLFRVISWQHEVVELHKLESWQKILFVGDSHIGCTVVEGRRYCNRVIWESSMPQQFTLMRLLDMERCGTLKEIEVVVLDFGLQSIGQQTNERMLELWWRMIPIAWRYPRLMPLHLYEKMCYTIAHINGSIAISEPMPTNNVSVLTRTIEERNAEFKETANLHFRWIDTPRMMCDEWEQSLCTAIDGIINVCKRNHIRLLVFTAPLTSYYRAAIPDNVEEKLQQFTNYMQLHGVEYYDLRDWGQDQEFRDCFHFTYDGARRFTERFYKEILKTQYYLDDEKFGDTMKNRAE